MKGKRQREQNRVHGSPSTMERWVVSGLSSRGWGSKLPGRWSLHRPWDVYDDRILTGLASWVETRN